MTMNDTLFQQQWSQLDRLTQMALRNFARSPTESNRAYTVGYLGALADRGMLGGDVGYWLAVCGQMVAGHTAQEFVLHA